MNELVLALWDLFRLFLVAGLVAWITSPLWMPYITTMLGGDNE